MVDTNRKLASKGKGKAKAKPRGSTPRKIRAGSASNRARADASADGAAAPPDLARIPTRSDEDAGWAEGDDGLHDGTARSSNDGLEGWDATPRGGFRQASSADDPRSWIVDRLLARRRLKSDGEQGSAAWQYLVRFLGKGEEEDRWVPESDLDPDLIATNLAEAITERASERGEQSSD